MLFRTKRSARRRSTNAQSVEPASPDREDQHAGMERPSFDQMAALERLGQTAVATVTVSELTGPMATWLMADLLDEIAASPVRHLVLDLQNVTYMDSSCLGALVQILTKLQESGGRIALVNAGHSVTYLFQLTRLDRLFPICRDVMTAISAVERAG